MANRLHPVVGNWYSHRDKGALFQVVALDAHAGTIEIQEFDGDIDELDIDEWRALAVDSAAQPEDWGGPLDAVESDEFGYTDQQELPRTGDPLDAAISDWEPIVEGDDFDEDPVH